MLRRAILPVDPLDWMGGAVGAYRFVDGREEGLFAETREEPEALQLVLNEIFHFGETQLDTGGVQGGVEFADGIRCGDVDTGHRLCRDHEPADWRRRFCYGV